MVVGKKVDWRRLKKTVQLATRFLDDIVDMSPFPFEDITKSVLSNRRIGLGIMGWADMLFELGIPYDSSKAMSLAKRVMSFISRWAWKTSEELAKEKGAFPNFAKSIYKDGKPRRNATVTTIAPTGSISIIANCSSGIEPVFALAYTHQVDDRVLHFVNPIFEKRIAKYKEGKRIKDEVKKLGSLAEVKEVPTKLREVFKTAHQIGWRWHIKTQAAFQKYTDNAVSKTINLPNSATVDEVAKAYVYAYRQGCRGITVFRDGCRSEQVLTSGTQEKKEEKGKEEFVVKERPTVVRGFTYRVETPVGTAFVTVNHNGHTDQPLELFINVGKAGSDIAADAEAMGRLISLCLRISSPGLSPRQVAELIVDQLEGIGGGGSVGFGKERVRSLADGIAKVIKKHLVNGEGAKGKKAGGNDVSLVGQQTAMPHLQKHQTETISRDICPNCGNASMVYEEGCSKCLNCGYSKC
jgi:ribonucleoside-diphosphate reductase alpha chain